MKKFSPPRNTFTILCIVIASVVTTVWVILATTGNPVESTGVNLIMAGVVSGAFSLATKSDKGGS